MSNKDDEKTKITIFNSVEEWIENRYTRFNWFERNIEIPFYRYFWNYVTNFYYGLRHLPGNIRKWCKFVWYDRDWDSCYSMEALEIKCRAQAKYLLHGNAEDSELYAQHALECADALKRLREDEYIDFHNELVKNNWNPDGIQQKYEEKRNVDLEIVKKSFAEMPKWWD